MVDRKADAKNAEEQKFAEGKSRTKVDPKTGLMVVDDGVVDSNPGALSGDVGQQHGSIRDNNLTNQDGQPLPIARDLGDAVASRPILHDDDSDKDKAKAAKDKIAADKKAKEDSDRLIKETKELEIRTAEENLKKELNEKKLAAEDKAKATEAHNRKIAEYQTMLKAANDSLGDRKVGEISLSHQYWGLEQAARTFAKDNGLI